MAKTETVQVSARVAPDARRRLRIRAAELDCTINDLIEALALHLDKMPDLPAWVAGVQADAQ